MLAQREEWMAARSWQDTFTFLTVGLWTLAVVCLVLLAIVAVLGVLQVRHSKRRKKGTGGGGSAGCKLAVGTATVKGKQCSR